MFSEQILSGFHEGVKALRLGVGKHLIADRALGPQRPLWGWSPPTGSLQPLSRPCQHCRVIAPS
jgi:hypothetical protein